MASLAVRYRETYHFNYANPREVYLSDVGEGVSVAVFGLLPEHRFPLECKDGELELHYAKLLARHDEFLFSLRKTCRRADAL